MAQSRGRVYIIMVQTELGTKERLKEIFEKILPNLILPGFKQGECIVPHARKYVKQVLRMNNWSPTVPPPSQDRVSKLPSPPANCWEVVGFYFGGKTEFVRWFSLSERFRAVQSGSKCVRAIPKFVRAIPKSKGVFPELFLKINCVFPELFLKESVFS